MLKYVVALLVLIVLLAGLYAIMPAASESAPEPREQDTAHEPLGKPSAWLFEDAGESNGIPQTKVSVDVHGQMVEVGVFEGNCGDMRGSAWKLAPGAAEGAICWFAGGGAEIAIFHEGDTHVIKSATLEEGTAEVGGFRGEFVTLLSI